LKKIISTK